MTDFLAKAWFVNVPPSFPSLSTSFGRENDAFLFSFLLILKTSVLRWTNQCQVCEETGRWIRARTLIHSALWYFRAEEFTSAFLVRVIPRAQLYLCLPSKPSSYKISISSNNAGALSRSTAGCDWRPNCYSLACLQPSIFSALKLAGFVVVVSCCFFFQGKRWGAPMVNKTRISSLKMSLMWFEMKTCICQISELHSHLICTDTDNKGYAEMLLSNDLPL